jgi:hypothetical protein
MSGLVDIALQTRSPVRPRTVLGRIATTIENPGDELMVTIGSFDGHRSQWGPCVWSPANALPQRGDDCLVLFDEDETPWVLAFELGNRIVQGTAANTVASPTDDLYVLVDGLPAPVGPCEWAPREVLPAQGDPVLVVFDEDLNPSAVVWTLPPAGSASAGPLCHALMTADKGYTNATTDGTAIEIHATPPIACDGGPVMVEFWAAAWVGNSQQVTQTHWLALQRDDLAAQAGGLFVASRWADAVLGEMDNQYMTYLLPHGPVSLRYRDTPPAGDRVYSVKAYCDANSGGKIKAGTGGKNQTAPAFLRVTRDG